jgi:hypothetical protein
MPPKKNATPAKQPEDSSVTFDESEDMSFRLSRVEGLVKGLVSKGELDESINKLRGDMEKNMKGSLKIGDLANLQVEIVESMGNMEKKFEERMEIIVNLIQHPEEKLPIDDNVGQGTHDERNCSHFEKSSFSKSTPGGFDSNTRSNQGWFPRGIKLPKIDMRKFDGKYLITWILQMEQFFDLHRVPNLQKVTIASLYIEPEQFVWYQWLCE